MYKNFNKPKRGFTFNEILTLLLIIALLLSLTIVSIYLIRRKTRNTQRVSDIKVIQSALELYRSDNRYYPANLTIGAPLLSPDGKKTYIKKVPTNPKPWEEEGCPPSDYVYNYYSPTSYVISFCLSDQVHDFRPGPTYATPQGISSEPLASSGAPLPNGWQDSGTGDIGGGAVGAGALAKDSSGTLYAAYDYWDPQDEIYKIVVLKLANGSWQELPGSVLAAGEEYLDWAFAVTPDGTPYVSYVSFTQDSKLVLKKFQGDSWVAAGPNPATNYQVYNLAMATDAGNNLNIVFEDFGNDRRLTAMRFNGSAWSPLGPRGFSAPNPLQDEILDIILKINPLTNEPYVLWDEPDSDHSLAMKRFTGGSWTDVGNLTSLTPSEPDTCFDINTAGEVYLAYRNELSPDRKGVVLKYAGGSWAEVPPLDFTPDRMGICSFTFDGNNKPTVGYTDSDGRTFIKANVMQKDTTGWVQVGDFGSFGISMTYTNSLLTDSAGKLNLLYYDEEEGRIRVVKYNQ